MVYVIELTETFTKQVAIHATSASEAIAKAHIRYNEGWYDLSCDYDSADFKSKVIETTGEDD